MARPLTHSRACLAGGLTVMALGAGLWMANPLTLRLGWPDCTAMAAFLVASGALFLPAALALHGVPPE